VQRGSRQHTQIRAKGPGACNVARCRRDRDEARRAPVGAPEVGEHAPTIERREREVEDDGVEVVARQQAERGLAVGCDRLLDAFGVEASLHHQHARGHRAPPP
jgi:hypothetical protein